MENESERGGAQRSHRRGSRYRARRRAVELLFEAELRDTDPVTLAEERVELAREENSEVRSVPEYAQHIIHGVAVELDDVDATIERHLTESWELDRLAATERAILRVAVWELLFNPDVPGPAAVAQGVDLAAELAGPESTAWCNALLDKVAHHRDSIRHRIAMDRDAVGAQRVTAEEAGPGAAVYPGTESERDSTQATEALEAAAREPEEAEAAPRPAAEDSGGEPTEGGAPAAG